MKRLLIVFLLLFVALYFGCMKEKSRETSGTLSAGTLQSDVGGDCLPKTVSGTYEATVALSATANFITIQAHITKSGSYTIYTDTVNGYYFRGTGVFTDTGYHQVVLKGSGTPVNSGINNFVVHYGIQICTIPVTVLPSGSGGPAVFTLTGSPGTCSGFTVNGSYAAGVPLNAGNTVSLSVNVTTIGTYNISTTAINGMTFSASGAFISAGVQNVLLAGSGTPAAGGNIPVVVTAGSSVCTFLINVSSTAAGTLAGGPGACTPFTVNGTYTAGTALSAGNTVQVQVNITTAGSVTVSTNTVTGFSFSYSGNLSTGTQVITLNGSGTPTTAGVQTFTATFGTSTCTFTVNVAGTSGAGTLSGGPGACTPFTVNGTYTAGTALTTGNNIQVQVNITTAGSVSVSTNSVTGFSFSYSGNLSTGTQMITLNGTGTPTTAGVQTFTATFGSSTCTFTVTVAAAPQSDYFPRTAGSNWSYEFDGVANDSLLRYATSTTIPIAGNTYTLFMENAGTGPDSSGYYRKNGGDYFEFFDFGTWAGYDDPAWGEYIMLKDNVAVNTNFKTPVAGFSGTASSTPIKLRFSFTIVGKDITVSFPASTGTMNFSNVIVVEEKLEREVSPGVWQDITSIVNYYGKSYYARNIGLIKFEALSASGSVTFRQELRRYQIY